MKKFRIFFIIFALLLFTGYARVEADGKTHFSKDGSQKVTELKLIEDEPQEKTDKDGNDTKGKNNNNNKSKNNNKGNNNNNNKGKDSNNKSKDSSNNKGKDNNKKETGSGNNNGGRASDIKIDKNGSYDSKEEVALYIIEYGKLPSNYITKREAQELGWTGGSLEVYAPGKCIGGSVFGNYEGNLPKKQGRKYYECDIDTLGAKKRGAKRLIYSNDGLIYYTQDHYESFELLYDGENWYGKGAKNK